MKKRMFIFFLTTTFLMIGSAQEIKHEFKIGLLAPTHQEQDQQFIYGKVKEIHYVAYRGKEVDGQIVKDERLKFSEASRQNILQQSWSYFFNEKGQMVKMALLDDELQPEWIGVVHYEEDLAKNIYWLHNDTLKSYQTLTYLDDNKIEKKLKYINNQELINRIVYTYNLKGHLTTWQSYGNEGQTFLRIEIARNEAGHQITRTLFDAEGKVTWSSDNYTYKNGLPVKSRTTVANREKVERFNNPSYEFDKHGNWILKIPAESKGIFVERSFVFYE